MRPSEGVGDAADNPVLQVNALVKSFRSSSGRAVPAVNNVSMQVARGEIVVLLGPSGCGKTTLLRCVAGLERPDGGEIVIRSRTVFSSAQHLSLPPEQRSLSMMFQSYALWPHMTAFENVAYPLQARSVGQQEIKARVARALQMVSVPHLAEEYPSTMSGGQQQRVALARALVSNSELVLFDEPLSNVDAKVREELRSELRAMQRKLNFGALYVTHDQSEALALGDRIAVLRDGEIVEMDTPRGIYYNPRSRYTSQFVGTTNEFPGRVLSRTGEHVSIKTEFGTIEGLCPNHDVRPDDAVVVTCRPEYCTVSAGSLDEGVNRWVGRVTSTTFAGSYLELKVDLDGHELLAWIDSRTLIADGASVVVAIDPADVRIFPTEDAASATQAGGAA